MASLDTTVERSPGPLKGSYRAEVVSIRGEGETLRVFLKDFGECKHLKENMAARRERELRVYRDVLAGADLDTPRYLGSSWDAGRERFWLLLEYVEGEPLRYRGLEDWLEAARWLGRLRVRVPVVAETTRPFLTEHDESFFADVAVRVVSAVGNAYPDQVDRLRPVLGRYEQLLPEMVARRPTLVHGNFRPYNIVVGREGERARLCPIDWEEAALGSPLYDLAQLADGFDLPRLQLLLDAHEDGLREGGLRPGDRFEALRLVRCFQLHRNLKTLAKSGGPGFSERGVEKLIRRSEELIEWLA